MFEKLRLAQVTDTGRKIQYSYFKGESDQFPIRLEEEIDSTGHVLIQTQMTADRIIVELDKNVYATAKAFREDITRKLSGIGCDISLKMLRSTDSRTTYLLQFDFLLHRPELYSLVLSTAKNMAISASPHGLQIIHIPAVDTVEENLVCHKEHEDNPSLMEDSILNVVSTTTSQDLSMETTFVADPESREQVSDPVRSELNAKNSLYLLGCLARDRNQDFKSAMKYFKDSNSFEGVYAIAELYHFGFNNTDFEKDSSQAVAYYLDAYRYHKDKFSIEVNNTPLMRSSSSPTLAESNELLVQAHAHHPEALYRLALFYRNEEIVPSDTRVISASTQELSERIYGCLKASADLYHPHAAYLLINEYGKQLNIEERLKYSRIAADPETARVTELTSSTTYTYRGAQPVTTELKLLQGSSLPLALSKQLNVGGNMNLKSLFQQNERALGGSILPEAHKPYDKTLINTLGGDASKTVLTKDEVNKLRAERLALPSSTAVLPVGQSHQKTDGAEVQSAAAEESTLPDKVSSVVLSPANSSPKLISSNIHQHVSWDPTGASKTKLDTFVKEHLIELPGLIEEVPNDGNCFFHALSRLLTRLNLNNITYIDLRLAGIRYIDECRDEFEQYFCKEGNSSGETESIDHYLERMSNWGSNDISGAWADGPMIMAIARKYNIHIYVTEIKETGECFPQHFNEDEKNESKPMAALALYQHHYYILNLHQHTNKEKAHLDSHLPADNSPVQIMALHTHMRNICEKLAFIAATIFSLNESSNIDYKGLLADLYSKVEQINTSIPSLFNDPCINFVSIIQQAKQDLSSRHEKIISTARATLLQGAAFYLSKSAEYNSKAFQLLNNVGDLYQKALKLAKETSNVVESSKIVEAADQLLSQYVAILDSRNGYYKTYAELYETGWDTTSATISLANEEAEKIEAVITNACVSSSRNTFFNNSSAQSAYSLTPKKGDNLVDENKECIEKKSIRSEQQIIEQYQLDSLTQEKQGFLEADAWSSLDEKIEHLIPVLIQFGMDESAWVASEEHVRYLRDQNRFGRYSKKAQTMLDDCMILLLLKKYSGYDILILDPSVTGVIKRLTILLIEGRIDIDTARELVKVYGIAVARAFNLLSEPDVESLKLIDWAKVTGVPFDHFPKSMTVEEILALPIEVVIRLLRNQNKAIQPLALASLRYLALNAQNRDVIREAGGIGLVRSLLDSPNEETKACAKELNAILGQINAPEESIDNVTSSWQKFGC